MNSSGNIEDKYYSNLARFELEVLGALDGF